MALIAALVMFLYHTCSVALAGGTLGMRFCGLQAVDARKACVPTTAQCMPRALRHALPRDRGPRDSLLALRRGGAHLARHPLQHRRRQEVEFETAVTGR